MSGFCTLYASQIRANALGGYLFPGFGNLTPNLQRLMKFYSIFSLLPVHSTLIAEIYLLLNFDQIEDIYLVLSMCNMIILVTFQTGYFFIYHNHLDSVIGNLDSMTEKLMNEYSVESQVFKENILKFARKMKICLNLVIIIELFLAPLDAVLKLLNQYGVINVFKMSVLYQMPYNPDGEYYILTLTWQVLSLCYILTKQLSCDFFFITVFLHLSLCFKHLILSFDRVFCLDDFVKTTEGTRYSDSLEINHIKQEYIRHNMRLWIQRHQEVLRYDVFILLLHFVLKVMIQYMRTTFSDTQN